MSHRPNAAPYTPRHANRRPTVPAPVSTARPLRATAAVGLLIGVIMLAGASESTPGAGANALRPEPDRAIRPEPPELAAAPIAAVAPSPRPRPPSAPPVPGQPVQVSNPAPATKPIISGLAANGIPSVALNAYRVAAARVTNVAPSCGMDWSLLAGIGRVESDHGRFAGAVLGTDGTSTPRIVGIPLDGTRSALIRDTDGGRLDGDSVFDRAVGPMQFIPSTWAHWGADANGDGVADPFNVNDAALAAARYLCAAGGDLRTTAGRIAAVLTYNYSDEYVARVLALAAAYASGVPVEGIPIHGRTTGPLPPANPGPPLAADAPPARPHLRPAHRPTASTSPTPSAPSGTPSTPPSSATPTPTPTSGGSSPTPTPTPSDPPSDPPQPGGLLCSILGLLIPCPPPR